jgi:hypothetical protein
LSDATRDRPISRRERERGETATKEEETSGQKSIFRSSSAITHGTCYTITLKVTTRLNYLSLPCPTTLDAPQSTENETENANTNANEQVQSLRDLLVVMVVVVMSNEDD